MNATPVYELLDEKGPIPQQVALRCCVAIDGKRFDSAWVPTENGRAKAALLASKSWA